MIHKHWQFYCPGKRQWKWGWCSVTLCTQHPSSSSSLDDAHHVCCGLCVCFTHCAYVCVCVFTYVYPCIRTRLRVCEWMWMLYCVRSFWHPPYIRGCVSGICMSSCVFSSMLSCMYVLTPICGRQYTWLLACTRGYVRGVCVYMYGVYVSFLMLLTVSSVCVFKQKIYV